MDLHHALKVEQFEAQGLPRREAELAAARAMGRMTEERATARRVWALRWADDLSQDLAFAIRSAVRAPLFTLMAVLGLAGGLGFCVAAYSAFNAIVLRGWVAPGSARLASLYAVVPGGPKDRRLAGFSYDELRELTARAQTLQSVFAWERARTDLTGAVTTAFVTPSYFTALGVPMAQGRGFRPEEDRLGAPARVIVISDHWWRVQLQGHPDVLGQSVRVSGVPFTVVGVTAPGFRGADRAPLDGWVPLAAMAVVRPKDRMSRTSLAQPDECCVQAGARLADGVSRADAEQEITRILAQLRRPGIDTLTRVGKVQRFNLLGTSGPGAMDEIVPVFALLFGGVGLVLVLACANVANLLLARAAVREREIGIRLALGASRGRLVRQLMAESLSLALLAVLPAVALASVLPDWIIAAYGVDDVAFGFKVDLRVLGVAVALAVMSCVVFGLAPALQASRPQLVRTKVPLRALFLSTQVAICLVLLVCTSLFFRSVGAGQSLSLGFDPRGVEELMLVPPADEDEAVHANRLLIEMPVLMAQLGVQDWALSEHPPFAYMFSRVQLGEDLVPINTLTVSGSYFGTLRMRFLAGRAHGDGATSAHEIVVNAALARELGGVESAVGRMLVVDSVPRLVVGVVANARDAGSVRDTLRTVYRPMTGRAAPRLVLRMPPGEAQRIAQAVRDRDASIGVAVTAYDWYVNRSFGAARGSAVIAGALGALALVLAVVGMFGVFAYWVQQRRRDIGIRMALGASRAAVLRMMLLVTARALGAGLVLGIGLAMLAARVLRGSLYGLSPLDPVSFAAAIGVLVASALVATMWPAWTASRVSPLEAIRSD